MGQDPKTRIFISYSRHDNDMAEQLHNKLHGHGFEVWRDQVNLYGGDRWPIKLGEAIADSGTFLLLWSATAAASHWVRFEWGTALALRKRIVPVRLDAERLPPSLAALNTLLPSDSDRLFASLSKPSAVSSAAERAPILEKLDALGNPSPLQAVETIRTFNVGAATFGGQANIAGRDINVVNTTGWPIVTLAAIALVVVAALGIWFQTKPHASEQPVSAPQVKTIETTHIYKLAGEIYDESSANPLPGVHVLLPEYNQKTTTNEFGRFAVEVTAGSARITKLIAQKNGYETANLDPTLGDQGVNLSLKRKH